MFNKIKDNFARRIQPTFGWKELFKKVKKATIAEDVPAVADDVDFKEFERRYDRVRFSAFVWMIGFVWCVISLALSTVWYGWFISLITAFICAQFYLRISMELFRARTVAADWDDRDKPNKLFLFAFIDAVVHSPSQFFPISLVKKSVNLKKGI